MSCNEWQAGVIKIPTKAFPTLYRAYIKGFNSIQLSRFNNLKALYDYIMIASKGKRGYNYYEKMEFWANTYRVSFDSIEKLFPDNRTKPLHPTKKMFRMVNTKTTGIELDEGTAVISFNKPEHSIYWCVSENNHACDRAHELPETQLLFSLLDGIKFIGKTGGIIVGNDEYNRDNMQSGGGANYVVFSYSK